MLGQRMPWEGSAGARQTSMAASLLPRRCPQDGGSGPPNTLLESSMGFLVPKAEHNAIADRPLADAQPIPEQRSTSGQPSPWFIYWA